MQSRPSQGKLCPDKVNSAQSHQLHFSEVEGVNSHTFHALRPNWAFYKEIHKSIHFPGKVHDLKGQEHLHETKLISEEQNL